MSNNKSQNKNWWTTLPGMITAVATLITAIAGFVAIFNTHNSLKNKTITSNDSSSHGTSSVIIKDSSKVEGVIGNVSGKNVNVGSNYGHIGDEYNSVKQRKVTLELVNKITSLNPNKKFPIGVYHTATDPETLNFVNALIAQLKQTGYKEIHTAGMSLFGDEFLKHPEYILAFPDTLLAEKDPDEFLIFVPASKNYY